MQLHTDCHKGANEANAASDISPHINLMTRAIEKWHELVITLLYLPTHIIQAAKKIILQNFALFDKFKKNTKYKTHKTEKKTHKTIIRNQKKGKQNSFPEVHLHCFPPKFQHFYTTYFLLLQTHQGFAVRITQLIRLTLWFESLLL